MRASEGIEQGDAAGPALFACGLRQPLDELRGELQDVLSQQRERRAMSRNDNPTEASEENAEISGCVSVFAYLDDTIVGVPAELAGTALPLAVETFARAGHIVHPGKSACWSHATARESLPVQCQNIWRAEGLKVGGIPVFDAAAEPVLAQEMLEKRLQKVQDEADFYASILFDDQLAAADTWCRV